MAELIPTNTENAFTYAGLCAQILQKPCNAGRNGFNWQATMGGAMDTEMSRLFYARAVRFPTQTPTDALYYLADERGLERVRLVGTGGTLEDETLHRLRLKHAWTIWQRSGSQDGHIEELGWCGINNAKVYRRVDWPSPIGGGTSYVRQFAKLVWSQFDILIRKPMPIEPLLWGSGWVYGDGSTWGTTMVLSEIQLLRRLVRDHKSAHNTCTYFHFAFTSGALWGTFRFGDGTLYGGSGDVVSIVCGEKLWESLGIL